MLEVRVAETGGGMEQIGVKTEGCDMGGNDGGVKARGCKEGLPPRTDNRWQIGEVKNSEETVRLADPKLISDAGFPAPTPKMREEIGRLVTSLYVEQQDLVAACKKN